MSWVYALLGLAAAIAIAAPAVAGRVREMRLGRAGLGNVATMTDEDMVWHMARLFGALGYRVFRPMQEESVFSLLLVDGLGQRRGVCIRHWRMLVDEQMVAAVSAEAQERDLAAPMLVSVEGYTFKAREEAGKAGAILWSLAELTEAIGRVKQAAVAYPELPVISTLEEVAPALGWQPPPAAAPAPQARRRPQRLRPGESWSPDHIPKCPRCGRKMVVRKGNEGEYWGCPLFPRCLGTRPKR